MWLININSLPLSMQPMSTFPLPTSNNISQPRIRSRLRHCPSSFSSVRLPATFWKISSASYWKPPCHPISRASFLVSEWIPALCRPVFVSWSQHAFQLCKPLVSEVELFFCNLLVFPVSSLVSLLSVWRLSSWWWWSLTVQSQLEGRTN